MLFFRIIDLKNTVNELILVVDDKTVLNFLALGAKGHRHEKQTT